MIDFLTANQVSIFQNNELKSYFNIPPFHPSRQYPEYPFYQSIAREENDIYDAVRNALMLLKLDQKHFGTKEWNPLGEIIQPGDKVVIKPNFVLDKHYENGDIDCVITHPSVIRAVCDYVYIALKGKGQLVIADAPQANCDFDNLLNFSNLLSISSFYKQEAEIDLPVFDLRQLKLKDFTDSKSRVLQEGDPLGYAIVNMGENSSFIDSKGLERLYGADFDRTETAKHHHDMTHQYCVSKTILSADVIISVPKMKVHRKAGVTLNLKNLIGINGNKNYLPHFKIGVPEDGGDEFPTLTSEQKTVMYSNRKLSDLLLAKPSPFRSYLYKMATFVYAKLKFIFPNYNVKGVISGGDWYGNDTIWRTLLDLNKILLYADRNGVMQREPQRRFFSIVDGVIGGENEGPLVPTAKPCGLIACGFNPLVTDMAVARVMGFNVTKIPKFKEAMQLNDFMISLVSPDSIQILSNIISYQSAMTNVTEKFLGFRPAKGWIGHIEY